MGVAGDGTVGHHQEYTALALEKSKRVYNRSRDTFSRSGLMAVAGAPSRRPFQLPGRQEGREPHIIGDASHPTAPPINHLTGAAMQYPHMTAPTAAGASAGIPSAPWPFSGGSLPPTAVRDYTSPPPMPPMVFPGGLPPFPPPFFPPHLPSSLPMGSADHSSTFFSSLLKQLNPEAANETNLSLDGVGIGGAATAPFFPPPPPLPFPQPSPSTLLGPAAAPLSHSPWPSAPPLYGPNATAQCAAAGLVENSQVEWPSPADLPLPDSFPLPPTFLPPLPPPAAWNSQWDEALARHFAAAAAAAAAVAAATDGKKSATESLQVRRGEAAAESRRSRLTDSPAGYPNACSSTPCGRSRSNSAASSARSVADVRQPSGSPHRPVLREPRPRGAETYVVARDRGTSRHSPHRHGASAARHRGGSVTRQTDSRRTPVPYARSSFLSSPLHTRTPITGSPRTIAAKSDYKRLVGLSPQAHRWPRGSRGQAWSETSTTSTSTPRSHSRGAARIYSRRGTDRGPLGAFRASSPQPRDYAAEIREIKGKPPNLDDVLLAASTRSLSTRGAHLENRRKRTASQQTPPTKPRASSTPRESPDYHAKACEYLKGVEALYHNLKAHYSQFRQCPSAVLENPLAAAAAAEREQQQKRHDLNLIAQAAEAYNAYRPQAKQVTPMAPPGPSEPSTGVKDAKAYSEVKSQLEKDLLHLEVQWQRLEERKRAKEGRGSSGADRYENGIGTMEAEAAPGRPQEDGAGLEASGLQQGKTSASGATGGVGQAKSTSFPCSVTGGLGSSQLPRGFQRHPPGGATAWVPQVVGDTGERGVGPVEVPVDPPEGNSAASRGVVGIRMKSSGRRDTTSAELEDRRSTSPTCNPAQSGVFTREHILSIVRERKARMAEESSIGASMLTV